MALGLEIVTEQPILHIRYLEWIPITLQLGQYWLTQRLFPSFFCLSFWWLTSHCCYRKIFSLGACSCHPRISTLVSWTILDHSCTCHIKPLATLEISISILLLLYFPSSNYQLPITTSLTDKMPRTKGLLSPLKMCTKKSTKSHVTRLFVLKIDSETWGRLNIVHLKSSLFQALFRLKLCRSQKIF